LCVTDRGLRLNLEDAAFGRRLPEGGGGATEAEATRFNAPADLPLICRHPSAPTFAVAFSPLGAGYRPWRGLWGLDPTQVGGRITPPSQFGPI
jgi:hypothetical protein